MAKEEMRKGCLITSLILLVILAPIAKNNDKRILRELQYRAEKANISLPEMYTRLRLDSLGTASKRVSISYWTYPSNSKEEYDTSIYKEIHRTAIIQENINSSRFLWERDHKVWFIHIIKDKEQFTIDSFVVKPKNYR